MFFVANHRTLRLWLGALIAWLTCQSGLFAQIGKVNCPDPPCCPPWSQWKLRDCLPCKHGNCPPLDSNFGYHPSTWRLWPGTKPNVTYENKRDLMLKEPTAVPDVKSPPGGAAMPGKEPETEAHGPAARFSAPLTALPSLPDDGAAPGQEASGKPEPVPR